MGCVLLSKVLARGHGEQIPNTPTRTGVGGMRGFTPFDVPACLKKCRQSLSNCSVRLRHAVFRVIRCCITNKVAVEMGSGFGDGRIRPTTPCQSGGRSSGRVGERGLYWVLCRGEGEIIRARALSFWGDVTFSNSWSGVTVVGRLIMETLPVLEISQASVWSWYPATNTDCDQHQRQQTMRANHAVKDPIFIQYIILSVMTQRNPDAPGDSRKGART
jgi:hypothetical protein